jgi:uncharacterized SAM-binding protein YcdF (DUF218 family)
MLFWLKKVVGFWLMPLPFSLALIVAGGLLWRFTKRRRLGRGLALAGALWLFACANVGIGTWMVRGLEAEFPVQPVLTAGAPLPDPLARCTFVAVLGGGHSVVPGWSANQLLSNSALARIIEGVRLIRMMPNARLIVSGPVDGKEGGPTHASLLAEVAVSLGVAPDRIIEISNAHDTEQEAVQIRGVAGDAQVALVTSAWHMHRTAALCRRQGLDVIACPSDHAALPPQLHATDFLRWNVTGLERSTKAVYEIIGDAWSRLRGKA